MNVPIVFLREDKAVGSAILLKQGRLFGDHPERKQDGGKREVVNMLVEGFFRSCGVAEVRTAHLPRFLSLHRRNEHAVIVYQHQRTILSHHDVVWL